MASQVFCISGSRRVFCYGTKITHIENEHNYLIQEEISNLSSTRVRFGTFVNLHSRQCNRSACRVKKMHHTSGTMAAQAMYRESTRISKFTSSYHPTLRHRSSARKHIFLFCFVHWREEREIYLHESVSLEVSLKHRALRTTDIHISGSFLLDQHETNALA